MTNTRDFLAVALPATIKEVLTLQDLTLDLTSYVSDELKGYFSDIVVKTTLKESKVPVDIYTLLEHKSYYDKGIFVQLLHYMYLMWQKDLQEKNPLRVIIPLVFYHGEQKWNIPQIFLQLFEVPESLKEYLVNFKYILFDTAGKDWEKSEELKQNVFLLSALLLMKSVFEEDLVGIERVFNLWREMGFVHNKRDISFFFSYILKTKETEKVKRYLEESERSDVMASLAEQLIQKGKREGLQSSLLLTLEARFTKVPKGLREKIEKIPTLEELEFLLKEAIKTKTLKDFQTHFMSQ